MEEICKAGLAYYANLSSDEEKLARNFFNKMFTNQREIGFDEYVEFLRKEGLPTKIANTYCFEVLDADKNGSLCHEDAKPLYYISQTKIISCDICEVLLTGLFFSCFQCFSDPSKETYSLCCDCYEGKSRPHHDDAVFYDSQTLLFNHKHGRQQKKKSDLQLTAEAYYETVPPNIKVEAEKFFGEMDRDGNKEIDLNEYVSFMRTLGYRKMANYLFFKELNGSGSGRLDFMEVMTLYYVIQSRRPFCDGCNMFMDGVFFTCYDCFNGGEDKTFDVCPACFKTKNYTHQHKYFIDNYALLESKRIEALEEKGTRPTNKKRAIGEARPTSSSLAIVPSSGHRRGPDKVRLLSIFGSLAGIAAAATSIAASCSIM